MSRAKSPGRAVTSASFAPLFHLRVPPGQSSNIREQLRSEITCRGDDSTPREAGGMGRKVDVYRSGKISVGIFVLEGLCLPGHQNGDG